MAARALAEEERLAWDRYAVGATIAGAHGIARPGEPPQLVTPVLAGEWADKLLEERRKRFREI
jgi:hypothetical protein